MLTVSRAVYPLSTLRCVAVVTGYGQEAAGACFHSYALVIEFLGGKVYAEKAYAAAGGLITYGASGFHMYHRAATFVDRIFKGAKPADLPVEQPTKIELVVNLKTARALRLTMPPALLARADRVIK